MTIAKKKRRAPREIARVVRKRKSRIMERMLRKLFPRVCETGRQRLQTYHGMTLAQAWKKVSRGDLLNVLKQAKVPMPERYRCKICGPRDPFCYYMLPGDAEEVRTKVFPKIPAQLVALYRRASKK